MKNIYSLFIAGIAAALVLPASLYATNPLPFSDSFEGDLSKFVIDDNSGDGVVATTTAQKVHGSQSALISNAVVTLNVTADTYDNVWIRLYAKPAPYDDSEGSPTPAADVAAAFYVNETGDLMAYSNTTWIAVVSGLPTSGWIGLSAQVDYANNKWDLYYETTGAYGTSLTRANTKPLDFNGAFIGDHMSSFAVDSGLLGYLDAMSLAPDPDSVAVAEDDANPNLAVDDLTLAVGTSRLGGFARGFAAQYLQDGEGGAITPLGNYLLSLMNDGDELYVQTASGALVVLTRGTNGGGPYWASAEGGNPWDIEVGPASAVRISRQAGGTTTAAFRKYGDAVALPTDVTIFGDGWTGLAWPKEFAAAINNLGFNAANGDRIYIFADSGPVILNFRDGIGWRQGASYSSYQFNPGQAFWYRRSAGGTVWNASTAGE